MKLKIQVQFKAKLKLSLKQNKEQRIGALFSMLTMEEKMKAQTEENAKIHNGEMSNMQNEEKTKHTSYPIISYYIIL